MGTDKGMAPGGGTGAAGVTEGVAKSGNKMSCEMWNIPILSPERII